MQMIQSSMKELQQLFFDLALLVDDQGEMIDSIQVNVRKSNTLSCFRSIPLLIELRRRSMN